MLRACEVRQMPMERGIILMNQLTYDDYWLSYLAGHARPLTRLLHYFGLFFGQLLGLLLSFYFAWWIALIICPLSYMIAYLSHELVEGNSNQPYATRPFWSVVGFFRMLVLDLTGRLSIQIARLTPEHFAAEHP
jgi:hypothetical protein